MSLSTYLALLLFSFVSSVTPGPNNIMLFASGVNFGVRRSIPHMLGISFGFGLLLTAVGAGLGAVLKAVPIAFVALKIVGGAYMLYLAWRIATSGPPDSATRTAQPMGFWEAVAFQWVNPKAWVMAAVAMATYTLDGSYAVNVLIVVLTFSLVNLPTISAWAMFGLWMRRFLSNPKILRIFNVTMAVALILSLWPMLKT